MLDMEGGRVENTSLIFLKTFRGTQRCALLGKGKVKFLGTGYNELCQGNSGWTSQGGWFE